MWCASKAPTYRQRTYKRDSAGRVFEEFLRSGKFKEYEYAKYGRVTRITHDCDKVEEQTYSYYSSGRLQEAVNEHARVSFRYDGMGQQIAPEGQKFP